MYLVIDVGGTFIKYAAMTGDGDILEKGKLPTPCKTGDGIDDFVASVKGIYDGYKVKENIEGIAMDLPGQIDVENGIVYGGGALKYLDEVRLQDLLMDCCDGVPVALENDGKSAALAELWKGNARDVNNACVIVFGTGVGGGIIINRKIHRGKNMLAGELSYFIGNMTRADIAGIEPVETTKDIYALFDANKFIMSSIASTSALAYHAAKLRGIKPEEINGELIYKWAKSGDTVMQELLEDFYFEIAKMCCSLYITIEPEIILLGGGISAEPCFIEGIRGYVEQIKQVARVYDGIKLDVCKYRNDSNLYGALYNFKQKYNMVK